MISSSFAQVTEPRLLGGLPLWSLVVPPTCQLPTCQLLARRDGRLHRSANENCGLVPHSRPTSQSQEGPVVCHLRTPRSSRVVAQARPSRPPGTPRRPRDRRTAGRAGRATNTQDGPRRTLLRPHEPKAGASSRDTTPSLRPSEEAAARANLVHPHDRRESRRECGHPLTLVRDASASSPQSTVE
jgi:hypothetical protein